MKSILRSVRDQESSLKLESNRQLAESRGFSLAFAGLLACSLMLAACQKTEIKPMDIITGDTCVRCKAPITDKHFAAEFVTRDGFVRKFDDISCMTQHAAKVGKSNIATYYVADFPSQRWLNAEEAYFVQSDQIRTPKNSGILTFKDQAQAKALADQYQAKLLRFNDILN